MNLFSLQLHFLLSNTLIIDLIGSIPIQLCNLITLRRLCICRCGLTGKIPDEIGQLINLEELQLFGNNLNGFIPNTIGNLIELKLLSFGEYTGGNNFTEAAIPFAISKLYKLEALFMANCNLKGSIPIWISDLKGMSLIIFLFISILKFHFLLF